MKKYELTAEFVTNISGTKLFRIKALVAFGDVQAGELGGYVEKEENISHDGNAWVYGDAWVSGNALVAGDACVSGNARVYDGAWVSGNALVAGDACVSGNARVYDGALVSSKADYAIVQGFGSKCRATTFYRQKGRTIGVTCGCFEGTLDEFRKKVKETHGDSKFAKEYLMIADLMEMHFEEETDGQEPGE